MKTTAWKLIDNGSRRIRATYGMHAIGNQEPYFSITGDIYRVEGGRWSIDSAGCLHDDIAKHFPELQPLIAWHLCSELKGPMHYVPNALYHLGVGRYSELNMDHFRSTVVFGALPDDEATWAEVEKHADERSPTLTRGEALKAPATAWLSRRFAPLMDVFRETMRKHEVMP